MILNKSLQTRFTYEENHQRGNIYDRNGVLLASSVKAYSLAANSKKIYGVGSSKKNAQQNAASKLLTILKIWTGKMIVIYYQKENLEKTPIL